MSEQVSEAVNPGQAIYDALSDEAKKAIDSLATSDSDVPVLTFLAESMRTCHEGNPNGWALLASESSGGEAQYLNVGVNDTILAGSDSKVVYVAFEARSQSDVELANGLGENSRRTIVTTA